MSDDFKDSKLGGLKTRYIEPKISLMWLITTTGSIATLLVWGVWNLSIANTKMEQMNQSIQRMEARLDSRDERLDRLTMEVHTGKAVDDVQNTRLSNLEEQMRAVKSFSGIKP